MITFYILATLGSMVCGACGIVIGENLKSKKQKQAKIQSVLTDTSILKDCKNVQEIIESLMEVRSYTHNTVDPDKRFEILKENFKEVYAERAGVKINPDIRSKPVSAMIMKYIKAFYEGKTKAHVDEHNITFSDGTQIWVANKYYSYAKIYRLKGESAPSEYNEPRNIDIRAFMEVVYLEYILTHGLEYEIKGLPTLV